MKQIFFGHHLTHLLSLIFCFITLLKPYNIYRFLNYKTLVKLEKKLSYNELFQSFLKTIEELKDIIQRDG